MSNAIDKFLEKEINSPQFQQILTGIINPIFTKVINDLQTYGPQINTFLRNELANPEFQQTLSDSLLTPLMNKFYTNLETLAPQFITQELDNPNVKNTINSYLDRYDKFFIILIVFVILTFILTIILLILSRKK